MNCEALPCWLLELSQLLVERRVFKKAFNHVLINEYEPGQGIMVPYDADQQRCLSHELITVHRTERLMKMDRCTFHMLPYSACRVQL